LINKRATEKTTESGFKRKIIDEKQVSAPITAVRPTS